jgi:nucleotide-binding universal stress UspA family protein
MTISMILVPTDFSETAQVAFNRACSMARQLNASLCLLHVQDANTLRTAARECLISTDSTDEDLEAGVSALIATRFSEMLAGIDPIETPIKTETCRGEPNAVIVEVARRIKADLIVMGLNGSGAMSQLAGLVLGSVCEHVLRNAPCPTLIVRLDHRQKSGS